MTHPSNIVSFWRDAGPDRWFASDAAFDATIRDRYLALWEQAAAGGLRDWHDSDEGLLALIILLDQFPRNIFRGDPRAYATDALARDVARLALDRGVDQRVGPDLRQFVYMPFMHSEHMGDQDFCVARFRDAGSADNLRFAEIHADIIRRFGRFPHRNAALGRSTTADEQALLDAGRFSA